MRKISSCLDSHAAIRHARHLMELQRVFLEAAPSSLKDYARVGYLKNGVLVLLAHNGAVAAKLNQMEPTLLNTYRERGFEITKVRISVQVT